MIRHIAWLLMLTNFEIHLSCAEDPVQTPRPVPATRPEMKKLLEEMKSRPFRFTVPELTEAEQQQLGERSSSYEARLRLKYIPSAEGTVFGAARRWSSTSAGLAPGVADRSDFTRNADPNMTLTYPFKTMLFWIVSRTNNCQYCLGHQEWKLSATGMSDDEIAALDADWSRYNATEQAAFAYARLLTYEPHRISDAEFAKVAQHYTPLQILEMTMSVGGNNAINRWKEGIGIPQSSGNAFARRQAVNHSASTEAPSSTFVTPTSPQYTDIRSLVAPLEIVNGRPSGKGVANRPNPETRDQVLRLLAEASRRTPRLPLIDEQAAARWLQEHGQETPVTEWVRLIGNFPNEGAGRLPGLVSREKQTGELTKLQKARINWIIARQDRAWYALGQAFQTLTSLNQSEQQIFALDGDCQELNIADQALFRFARNLAASPIAATDRDAENALRHNSPMLVVQTVNHVASGAYFNRVTEAAGLRVGR